MEKEHAPLPTENSETLSKEESAFSRFLDKPKTLLALALATIPGCNRPPELTYLQPELLSIPDSAYEYIDESVVRERAAALADFIDKIEQGIPSSFEYDPTTGEPPPYFDELKNELEAIGNQLDSEWSFAVFLDPTTNTMKPVVLNQFDGLTDNIFTSQSVEFFLHATDQELPVHMFHNHPRIDEPETSGDNSGSRPLTPPSTIDLDSFNSLYDVHNPAALDNIESFVVSPAGLFHYDPTLQRREIFNTLHEVLSLHPPNLIKKKFRETIEELLQDFDPTGMSQKDEWIESSNTLLYEVSKLALCELNPDQAQFYTKYFSDLQALNRVQTELSFETDPSKQPELLAEYQRLSEEVGFTVHFFPYK